MKWMLVAAAALVLAGAGFLVGRTTAPEDPAPAVSGPTVAPGDHAAAVGMLHCVYAALTERDEPWHHDDLYRATGTCSVDLSDDVPAYDRLVLEGDALDDRNH